MAPEMALDAVQIAVLVPLPMALVATAIAWRRIKHRLLYFFLVLCTFQALASKLWLPIGSYFFVHAVYESAWESEEAAFAVTVMSRYIALALSALIGGIVAWRLALIFRRPPTAPPA